MLESILARQPQDGTCLFVDMNSFFASVEQQLDPTLRGQPVGVCPFVHDSTVVIAASVEAKRYGVKTGTNVADAKRLCPNIRLVSDNVAAYRHYHRLIMHELEQTRCQVLVKSIDEALCVVPSDLRDQPKDLAIEIKQRIKNVGEHLTCSIGIASNMFLAKMGSNFMKPNGLVEIKNTDLEVFYSMLTLTDLHGISWRMARRLNLIGIYTPVEFSNAPYSLLHQAFGANGQAWYLRLRGYEVDTRPTKRRTVGHQATLSKPAASLTQVLSAASQLTYKAASRLRRAGLTAKGVAVYLRYANGGGKWFEVYHGRSPFTDSLTFFNHAQRLLAKAPLDKPVRLVSVTAIDIHPADQGFAQPLIETLGRSERLSAAIDEIESKYGRLSVRPADQLLTDDLRDRIGFGNQAQVARELPK